MVALDWGNIAKSPLVWVVGVLILLGIAFWLGTAKGRDWADSKYLQEREQRTQQIAVHEAKEKELAVENDKLKAENEAKAEILRKADTAAEAKAAQKFQELQDQRNAKSDEIQNASPNESIAGLCADAQRAGYTLSFCR